MDLTLTLDRYQSFTENFKMAVVSDTIWLGFISSNYEFYLCIKLHLDSYLDFIKEYKTYLVTGQLLNLHEQYFKSPSSDQEFEERFLHSIFVF